MERRGFLGCVFGLCAVPFGVVRRTPPTHQMGGKFIEITASANHHMEDMFELGSRAYHKYAQFPIEVEITIRYESGTERFVANNVSPIIVSKILRNPASFLRGRTKDDRFGLDIIEYEKTTFRLAWYSYRSIIKGCKE